MKLVRVDSVALGAFNTLIPQPSWYARLGFIDPKTQVNAELALGATGARYTMGDVRWAIASDRFIAEVLRPTDENVASAADLLAFTLKHLEHTPLNALGNNVEFELGEARGLRQALHAVPAFVHKRLSRESQEVLSQLVLKGVNDTARVTLTCTMNPDSGLRAAFNFHRIVGSGAEGVSAAQKLREDFDWARATLGDLVRDDGGVS